MHRYIVCILVVSAGVVLPAGNATAQIAAQDSLALVTLYNSTGGTGWRYQDNWLTDKPLGNWHGIVTKCFEQHPDPITGRYSCTKRGIYNIYRSHNWMTGQIPSDLGILSDLEDLTLSNNRLTGAIPVELGNLHNLKRLRLGVNQLSGTIPTELGRLADLEVLRLESNELHGIIPIQLASLHSMQKLRLDENLLSGPIPVELSNLSNLQILDLSQNQLSGPIPVELSNLSNLQILDLSQNQLSGPIPVELSNLSELQSLELYSNQLTGTIPSELGNLSNLNRLYINNAQLTGPIPPGLSHLNNLYELRLTYNQLSGPIPPELGNLPNLSYLDLSINQLSENIPPELGNLSNLNRLRLTGNQLSGPIPPVLGNLPKLRTLLISNNQLSGPIPPELGNLSTLEHLWSTHNQLSGPIPPELGNLLNLYGLSLAYNQITGPIPPELGNLPRLNWLYLSSNQLSGHIPSELGNISTLESLQLGNNKLSGPIPPELGNLTNLKYLRLGSNTLGGLIPRELGNLSNLNWLYLNSNQLTGAVPPEIKNLSKLTILDLGSNNLDSLPNLSSMSSLTRLNVTFNNLTFEDIEPNIGIPNFTYWAQDSVGTYIDTTANIGHPLILSINVGGTANTYQWFHNNMVIPGATGNTYSIPAVAPEDSGSYTCWIRNTIATQLVLYARPINVSVDTSSSTIPTDDSPSISVAPASLDFGSVVIPDSISTAIIVSNPGTAELVVSSITIIGLNATDFHISPLNLRIAPGDQDTLRITFAPDNIGVKSATIWMNHNIPGNRIDIPLGGVGVEPPLIVNTTTASFDSTAVSDSTVYVIIISNTSEEDLGVNGINLSGPDADDFTILDKDIGDIAAGSQDTIRVLFTPDSTGSKTAQLELIHDESNDPIEIQLIGEGIEEGGVTEETSPAIAVNPTHISFDSTAVSDTTYQKLVVSNPGTADLSVSTISISGLNTENFGISPDSLRIIPGSEDTLLVLFTPDSTGNRIALLQLIHNASVNPFEVQLSGVGIEDSVTAQASSPTIGVNPVSVVFDSTTVADSTSQTIVVSNSGTADLVIGTITITGTDTGLFDVDPSSMTITPGSQDTLLVTFHPDSAGSKAATLQLNHNASPNPLEIALSGIGIDTSSVVVITNPAISVSPTSVTFDSVAVSDSTVQVIVVSNPGTADLVISNIAVTGLDMGMFKVPTSSMSSVIPGGQDSIRIVFYPDSPGPKSATLQISHNAATSPFSIPLVGTGIEVPDGVDENERFVYSLGQNYPNPFNPQTKIRYGLPEAMHMRLTVYSITGQEVRVLIDGQQSAGMHEVVWDGRDNIGRPLSSGVYLYRMETAHFVKCLRMVRLK